MSNAIDRPAFAAAVSNLEAGNEYLDAFDKIDSDGDGVVLIGDRPGYDEDDFDAACTLIEAAEKIGTNGHGDAGRELLRAIQDVNTYGEAHSFNVLAKSMNAAQNIIKHQQDSESAQNLAVLAGRNKAEHLLRSSPPAYQDALTALTAARQALAGSSIAPQLQRSVEARYQYVLAKAGTAMNQADPQSFDAMVIVSAWIELGDLLTKHPDLQSLFSASEFREIRQGARASREILDIAADVPPYGI